MVVSAAGCYVCLLRVCENWKANYVTENELTPKIMFQNNIPILSYSFIIIQLYSWYWFRNSSKKNEKNIQTERLIPLYRAGQRELYQPGRLLNMPEYHPMAANRSAATWPSSTWCPTMVVSLFNSSLWIGWESRTNAAGALWARSERCAEVLPTVGWSMFSLFTCNALWDESERCEEE